MPDDFADFISEDEMREILAVEEEFGVDISLDDIFDDIDDNDEGDSDWAE